MIAGGPVGRYIVGIALGWRLLDNQDGGGLLRLEIGVQCLLGIILGMITTVSIVNRESQH